MRPARRRLPRARQGRLPLPLPHRGAHDGRASPASSARANTSGSPRGGEGLRRSAPARRRRERVPSGRPRPLPAEAAHQPPRQTTCTRVTMPDEHAGACPAWAAHPASISPRRAQRGVWELLPCDSQVLAVHAALMHTGKVLFFAGSGNDELYTTGLRSVVWDYENGRLPPPVHARSTSSARRQTFLADGRLLVVGGTLNYALHRPRIDVPLRPGVEEWIRVGDMYVRPLVPDRVDARRRPRARRGRYRRRRRNVRDLLADDRLVAPDAAPRTLAGYPNLLLLRDGCVLLHRRPLRRRRAARRSSSTSPRSETPVPGSTPPDSHGMAPSVLLPPAQSQRVMVFGGGGPGGAVRNTSLVDLTSARRTT